MYIREAVAFECFPGTKAGKEKYLLPCLHSGKSKNSPKVQIYAVPALVPGKIGKGRKETIMQGQLDIFSYLNQEAGEPPILLSKGQTVYLVNKAEIIKCTVSDNEESWICGENNRGYRLIRENGLYSCT